MKVITQIITAFQEVEVQMIGPAQTIIEVVLQKKAVSIPFFLLIWFLLFFGAALTIINFHEDVSMKAAQQTFIPMITGEVEAKPLHVSNSIFNWVRTGNGSVF